MDVTNSKIVEAHLPSVRMLQADTFSDGASDSTWLNMSGIAGSIFFSASRHVLSVDSILLVSVVFMPGGWKTMEHNEAASGMSTANTGYSYLCDVIIQISSQQLSAS